MPVVGNRKTIEMGKGYLNDPISQFASTFRDMAQNILTESGTDIFSEPSKVMMVGAANDTMRNFFIEESADRKGMTAQEYDDHVEMMNEMYENDRAAVLEYASIGQYNPVIGMTFPLHKNILMNNIFDKGAIPKVVAREPKFTVSMETRYLVTPEGKKIDMFKNQMDMTDAIEATAPFVEVELALPEYGQTDILDQMGASSLDNLSIETHICAVKVANSESTDKWCPVRLEFTPNYGEFDRSLIESIKVVPEGTAEEPAVEDVISATMHNNKLQVASLKGKVKAVKIKARKDTSNGLLQTCSVEWGVKTDIIEIPSAIPINTPISPDEVKDIGALYQVNQLSKIMSMFKTVMENYKDDKIKRFLDQSYATMDADSKFSGTFDMAPREGYALDHVEWLHKTFMFGLDSLITEMLQVLNDPNMTISIFGRPDLIRKITPTEYTYQTPSSIGPVELDFVKTVTTSDKRTYHFVSSPKLRSSDELIIILCPRNTDRFVYRIYDYQMYCSNEIRNASLHTLPAVHCYERFVVKSYQPVQARLNILNPSGLK